MEKSEMLFQVSLEDKKMQGDFERQWYVCPHCGQKLLLYDSMAVCSGVFVICKGCKKEVEIKIKH